MKLLSLSLAVLISFSASLVNAEESTKTDAVQPLKAKLEEIQKQLDQLVNQGGKYAYVQLARKDGLSPFAVAVDEQGTTIMLEIPKEEKKANIRDKVLKLREMLVLGAQNAKFVAGALFVQAKVPHRGKEVDGVAIEMEHRSGLSVLRFSPYEINREKKDIKFKKAVDKKKPFVFFKESQQLAAQWGS